MNETENKDLEGAEGSTAAIGRRRRAGGGRRAGKRRVKKAAPAQQHVKVDPAQALAFVRSRIRETKDPIVKALFEREAAELSERVDKAEEQRRAALSVKTNDGKTAKIGDTIYRLLSSGRYGEGPPVLETLVIRNIEAPPANTYGGPHRKVVMCSLADGKGTRTLNVSQYDDEVYSSRDACFDYHIKRATEELNDKREEFDAAHRALAILEALRAGREPDLPPAPEKPRRQRRARSSTQQSLLPEGAEA